MQKAFFHTFGCRLNQYETESIRGKLTQLGIEVSEDFKDSDICVINTCSVTSQADQKCRQWVRKILRGNRTARLIVTGCYATRDPKALLKISDRIEIFSNEKKDSIPEIVSGCSLHTNTSPLLTHFFGHTRAFIKVQDGCDAPCTYCIIPKLRPHMKSRTIEEIRSEVQSLLKQGYREIVLTGIRLGSYGLSSSGGRVGKVSGNLVGLLKQLIQIPGSFRIRLSSLEISELTDELIELVRSSDKICPNFHLPLQSGDDSILRRMGRWYDTPYFSERIQSLIRSIPDAGLTTDVIVGFPGEEEMHFENTTSFLQKNFHGLHVFPFSSRPRTPAERLPKQNNSNTIQGRVQRLLDLDFELRKNFQSRFLGQKRLVLAESEGGYTDNGIWISSPFPFQNGTMDWVVIP